jgi:hypothetical protein
VQIGVVLTTAYVNYLQTEEDLLSSTLIVLYVTGLLLLLLLLLLAFLANFSYLLLCMADYRPRISLLLTNRVCYSCFHGTWALNFNAECLSTCCMYVVMLL